MSNADGVSQRIADYWDRDAATYDRASAHNPRTAGELSAWRGALRALLPPPPCRVLDVGAGTGFLSLLLAEQGYDVTAVDVAASMLESLRDKASGRGLSVATVQADAANPPAGSFDAIVERHVFWTLTDHAAALAAWRKAAPSGRLVLIESVWGAAAGPAEGWRSRGRGLVDRWRRTPPDHHASYDEATSSALRFAGGTKPAEVCELVGASEWGAPRLHSLRDVEWAITQALPLPERLLGTHPRFAVVAGQ